MKLIIYATLTLLISLNSWAVRDPVDFIAESIGVSKHNSFNSNLDFAFAYIQSDFEVRNAESNQLRKWFEVRDYSHIEKFLGSSSPSTPESKIDQFDIADLDMFRPLSQALSKYGKIVGTGCRIRAQLVSQLLVKGGMKPQDIQILETVTDDDFKQVCPTQGKNATSLENLKNKKVGMAGHTYVLANVPSVGWRLFNPNFPLNSDQNLKGKGFPFSSPDEVNHASEPIILPSDANPWFKIWGNLRAFSSTPIDKLGYYRYSQRNNFIASGDVNNSKCKWSFTPAIFTGQSTRAVR